MTTPELEALSNALQNLSTTKQTSQIPHLARIVTRATDDLELRTLETTDTTLRQNYLSQISHARTCVRAARQKARDLAHETEREQLLPDTDVPQPQGAAASIAGEINDRLRRTTAVVTDEISRSRAAGDVISESSRRLRMTKTQHGRYGEALLSGGETLKSIRRTDVIANVLLILSFVLFFVIAAHITRRKVVNSNIAAFIVRPGVRVASAPVRLVAWVVRKVGGSLADGADGGRGAEGVDDGGGDADAEVGDASEFDEDGETGRLGTAVESDGKSVQSGGGSDSALGGVGGEDASLETAGEEAESSTEGFTAKLSSAGDQDILDDVASDVTEGSASDEEEKEDL